MIMRSRADPETFMLFPELKLIVPNLYWFPFIYFTVSRGLGRCVFHQPIAFSALASERRQIPSRFTERVLEPCPFLLKGQPFPVKFRPAQGKILF
jgi:hypothetical protein